VLADRGSGRGHTCQGQCLQEQVSYGPGEGFGAEGLPKGYPSCRELEGA
jgi:hypothetical protein